MNTIADYPFDNKDADVLLRTTDGVDFYIHGVLLSILSPVFAAMFTLPQGPEDPGSNKPHRVVDMSECSERMLTILTWCDPRCSPNLKSWEQLSMVLELAIKYDMAAVQQRVSDTVMDSHLVAENPLKAYAIGVRTCNANLARAAAKEMLRIPPDERMFEPELRNIPASALFHVDAYYYACGNAASAVAESSYLDRADWAMESLRLLECEKCPARWRIPFNSEESFNVGLWWQEYVSRSVRDHLRRRPRGATIKAPLFAQDALTEAGKCEGCQRNAYSALMTFNQALATAVEQRIDELSLTLDF